MMNFDFDAATTAAYTYSDCWALAYALHKLAGAPVVAVGCDWTGEAVTGAHLPSDGQWGHMGVLLKNGNVVDVEGIHSPAEFLNKWQFAANDDIKLVNMSEWGKLTDNLTPQYALSDTYKVAHNIIQYI